MNGAPVAQENHSAWCGELDVSLASYSIIVFCPFRGMACTDTACKRPNLLSVTYLTFATCHISLIALEHLHARFTPNMHRMSHSICALLGSAHAHS